MDRIFLYLFYMYPLVTSSHNKTLPTEKMKTNIYIILNTIWIINISLATSECNYKGLILYSNYDPSKVPPFGDESVVTSIKLLKVLSVDDFHTTMTLVTMIYFTWKESRITINGTSLENELTRLF